MRIISWLSICFIVSSATPTAMRIDVPPKANAWTSATARSTSPIALDVNYTKAIDYAGTQQRQFYSLLSGIKVSRRFGRLEPFGKFGAGVGHISAIHMLTYHQYGQHFAIGMGGGLDYRLTNRIMLRPVDFTSERWNFYPHALSPYVLGFGLSFRIH